MNGSEDSGTNPLRGGGDVYIFPVPIGLNLDCFSFICFPRVITLFFLPKSKILLCLPINSTINSCSISLPGLLANLNLTILSKPV